MYFDYAAATPLHREVFEAMQPFFIDQFYNPSALYLAAVEVRKAVEQARSDVAQCLGARPSEIIFTAGGTEANNLAITGVMQRYPQANMVVSSIEHDSVLETARQYTVKTADVETDGSINIEQFKTCVDDSTVLVSVGWVNNEIGTIQSLSNIYEMIANIRKKRQKENNSLPLFFHTDACQAGNYLSLQVSKLGVDLMTVNGGKVYGPKQSGALYVKAGIELQPLVYGGGQERGVRSGTENVSNIVGFAKALSIAQHDKNKASSDMKKLQDYFFSTLEKKLPTTTVNGSLKQRIVNNVHLTFSGADNERLMMKLDEQGIMCAVGSACSASKDEPSHVLNAIGLSNEDSRASLRFSMGQYTQKSDIDTLVTALASLA